MNRWIPEMINKARTPKVPRIQMCKATNAASFFYKYKVGIIHETSGKVQPYLPGMERRYLNEKHRQYSEACQKEVREMMTHPLPREEKEKQMQRNRAAGGNGVVRK